MAITVNTNMQALTIQKNLSNATDMMNTAMQRMSSGYKINSAKDDAAGYAVSTKLETSIKCSKTASDNVAIGMNLLDTSEGSYDTVEANLERIRDLAEQASNGTYSSEDVSAIVSEIVQRIEEINRSTAAATFNDVQLFDSSSDAGTNGLKLQIGTESTDVLSLDNSLFSDATVSALGLFGVTATTSGLLQLNNGSGANVTIYGGAASSYATGYQIGTATGGLNATVLTAALNDVFTGAAHLTNSTGAIYTASNFLNNCDDAIAEVTDRLTDIGAYQNRLESIAASLEVQQTNLTSANSTIKDADVASESAEYVKAQILQSASATLLTQANSAPQIALTLIQGQ